MSVSRTVVLLTNTDLTVPVANSRTFGGSQETFSGQCQFTDLQATNYPNLYYRVRWP
jgi:hypothetical protein